MTILNAYVDFTVTLEIGAMIMGLSAIVAALTFVITKRKMKKQGFDVDEYELGLTGGTAHLVCNQEHRQVAYKIWVDINTRAIGVKINLDYDLIHVINESYYKCFVDTRELLKSIPVAKAGSSKESENLVYLIMRFLNEVMRPYLSKWGVKYKQWYLQETGKPENQTRSPIEIQRGYQSYEEICRDLMEINVRMINYSDNLKRIAFSSK